MDAVENVVVRGRREGWRPRDHDRAGGPHPLGPIRISWGSDVEVRIACPAGTDLDLADGSTELRVVGRLGEVSARSVSGDLGSELGIADESPAEGQGQVVPLHVKTVSGDVTIVRAAESVSA